MFYSTQPTKKGVQPKPHTFKTETDKLISKTKPNKILLLHKTLNDSVLSLLQL